VRKELYLLRDPKSFQKVCKRLNHDLRCRHLFQSKEQCLNCPVWIFREIERLVSVKGMSLGDSYNATVRFTKEKPDER